MLDTSTDDQIPTRLSDKRSWTKVFLLAVVILAIGLAWWIFRGQFGVWLSMLADREAEILAFLSQHPWQFLALAYGIYTLVTGVSLPGAAVMTLILGWLFQSAYGDGYGWLMGMVVVSFASTSGATIAFFVSRYLFRERVQGMFGSQLTKFNQAFEREGAFYLFSLRLIPVVQFFVINVVMGLTPIRARTYWWVSQLGMLPGTAVYVYAGTQLPGPKQIVEQGASGILTWQLALAFTLLGIFPLVVKRIMQRLQPENSSEVSSENAE